MLNDVEDQGSRLETSGSRLEHFMKLQMADLNDRLEVGLQLNRDETDGQISGLRKRMIELHAQQQQQQQQQQGSRLPLARRLKLLSTSLK
jgi:hypothetical protein